MGVTKRIITEHDEDGQLMLIQDLLMKREYDNNHEPIKAEAEPLEFSPVVETVAAKVGFRRFITKLTGGLL